MSCCKVRCDLLDERNRIVGLVEIILGPQLLQHGRALLLAAERARDALVDVGLEEIALERALDDAAVEGELETFLDDDAAFDQFLNRREQFLVNILDGGDALMHLTGEHAPLPLYVQRFPAEAAP